MSREDNRDSPQWHGGTLGDRFADAGHAERPDPMRLQDGSGGGRNPAGRSCAIQLGVGVLAAVALLAMPFLPVGGALRRGQ
jgi:hypothetical protein